MKRYFIVSVCIWLGVLLLVSPAPARSIKQSKHNLSSGSGLGTIKSSDTSMICIFCHTSHIDRVSAPLWNREEGAPVYTLYTSSTMQSLPGQPDGASKLCLSCHDGTIALGKVRSRSGQFNMLNAALGKIPPGRSSNLGSDLSDDHPISIEPSMAVSASPELNHPLHGDKVKYDKNGKLQCTTCHDPHNDMNQYFLVKANHGAGICKTCHQPAGFNGLSIHDTSPNTWNNQNSDPWPHTRFTNVTDNSCMNCHRSHNADGKERLLSDSEEGVCLVCHNGNVGQNIRALLNKTSGHSVKFYQGGHDAAENILTAPKHVECVDCHSPHSVNATQAQAPHVNGRLTGASGMSINGALKSTAQFEYEICIKCHGQDKYRVTTTINRQFDTSNIRLAISPSNASFHALAARGTGNWVPSLIPPYTTSSRLYCTDCHNSDASKKAGGSGPDGPHGSRWEYLLERRYETSGVTPWSADKYALCFKCHNPNTLMDGNISGFAEHDVHVREEGTPCSACHDPHGSPNHVGLINFDTNQVFPNRDGQLRFEVIGDRGYCYLDCHGENHNPESYRRK